MIWTTCCGCVIEQSQDADGSNEEKQFYINIILMFSCYIKSNRHCFLYIKKNKNLQTHNVMLRLLNSQQLSLIEATSAVTAADRMFLRVTFT